MTRLLLVPTRLELAGLAGAPSVDEVLAGSGRWRGFDVGLCGVGPVEAAVGAMEAFTRRREVELCVLAGLAGSLDEGELGCGEVCEGAAFRLHGVGVGREPELASLDEVGLADDACGSVPATAYEAATACLGLDWVPPVELLTVCAASRDRAQARFRRDRFREARAEEMEGFAVARAARRRGIPFTCLRAISNVAGDRDPADWDAGAAMAALSDALAATL